MRPVYGSHFTSFTFFSIKVDKLASWWVQAEGQANYAVIGLADLKVKMSVNQWVFELRGRSLMSINS